MDADLVAKAAIAFGPALILLLVFDRLDVFNLIPARTIALLLAVGGGLAALSFLANWGVLTGFRIEFGAYSRYVAPFIEEGLKAAPIAAMYAYNRIGFKLDAVIAGFAIGAGFSAIENAWYLLALSDANLSAWLLRGFGTAIMHGGATALFAVISHEMTERQAESAAAHYRFNALLFAPGLGAAIVIHSAFNHLTDQPVLGMVGILLLAPATLFFALARSERATQHWLKADEAAHRLMLAEIRAGHFADTSAGHAMHALAAKLPPALAADVAACVELKIELVLRAEELILAAHSNAPAEFTPSDVAKFAELQAVEQRLGKSAIAAIDALLGLSRNDLWELSRLRARIVTAPPHSV
jgi:RsiW-degrading membrane proteinase PrsW (M82 family)